MRELLTQNLEMSLNCAMSMQRKSVKIALQDFIVVEAVRRIPITSMVPSRMPMRLAARCKRKGLNVPL